MDYSIILNSISNNQAEIITVLKDIHQIGQAFLLLATISFIYVFVRNLIKN